MKIGELAARAGVTTKAVRYYESLGLITPGRLANGYRDYDEADVRLIREIRSLRELGIQAERTSTVPAMPGRRQPARRRLSGLAGRLPPRH